MERCGRREWLLLIWIGGIDGTRNYAYESLRIDLLIILIGLPASVWAQTTGPRVKTTKSRYRMTQKLVG
jgi:hypothetical protein